MNHAVSVKILKLRSRIKGTSFRLTLMLESFCLLYTYTMVYLNGAYTTSVTSVLFWLLLVPVYFLYLIYGNRFVMVN